MEIAHLNTLNELQRRHYLATLAVGLVNAGVMPVVAFFGVSKNTVYKAISEIMAGYSPGKGRIRRPGGGAKRKLSKHPEWQAAFNEIVQGHMAAPPQDESVIWLDINTAQIVRALVQRGCKVSRHIVEQMIENAGLRKRSFSKSMPMGQVAERDAQFRKIDRLVSGCVDAGIPVVSADTKKKELIGNFKRDGKVLCNGQPKAFDHDFGTFAKTTITPHGIYNIGDNTGYVAISTSHDTSMLFCDHLRMVWCEYLQWQYPDADTLAVLCDGGGSNSCRHWIVKQDLLDLSKELDIKILMIHYPPHCSKFNPIEHRLFSQITRSWCGAPLLSVGDACRRAANTATKTGLKVVSYITDKVYETKRAIRASLKQEVSSKSALTTNSLCGTTLFCLRDFPMLFFTHH